MYQIKIIILSLFVLGLTTNSAFSKNISWRMAEVWTKGDLMFGNTVRSMAESVNAMSGGEFTIEVFSREDHNNSLGVFDMVKEGQYEIGHAVSNWWTDKDINTTFFSSVPMGMIATEKHAWFYHGGGLELMQRVYEKYGLYSFPGGNNGTEMGGWFKEEVKSLDDLKGLKVRVPGLGGQIYTDIGAEVTMLPPGKLYEALDNGTLDALEFVGPSLDYGLKFHEIAKYYYTGWHSPGSEVQFLVNREAYESLPEKFKVMLKVAMKSSASEMLPLANHMSAVNLDKILTEHPEIKIRAFPNSVFREFNKRMDERLDTIAEEGNDLTREIIESQRDYLRKIRQWTRFSDQAYLNNSFK